MDSEAPEERAADQPNASEKEVENMPENQEIESGSDTPQSRGSDSAEAVAGQISAVSEVSEEQTEPDEARGAEDQQGVEEEERREVEEEQNVQKDDAPAVTFASEPPEEIVGRQSQETQTNSSNAATESSSEKQKCTEKAERAGEVYPATCNPDELLIAHVPSGYRFSMPATPPAVNFSWKDSTTLDWIQRGMLLFNLILLVLPLSYWVYIVYFLFWRFAYNAGLGWLLKKQSETGFMTEMYRKFVGISREQPNITKPSLIVALCHSILKIGVPSKDYDPANYPAEFNAWVLYRVLVDVVLNNDLFSYVIFCIRSLDLPDVLSFERILILILCYIVGVGLCAFTVWAKVDAYRVVKDFAWYWGDFFFLVDQNLTFDRIFAMFPHPMYTIGYAFFYGASLLTQSHTVLYVSMFAHALQLTFLSLVENPHIEKTYPSIVQDQDPQTKMLLYDSRSGYFRKDMIVFKNFNPFRSSDIFTLVSLTYTILQVLFDLPSLFFVLQAIVWRLIYSVALGYVLHKQSSDGNFVRMFLERGATRVDAFENWKRIRNFVIIMTWTSFVVCAFHFIDFREAFSSFYEFKWFCLRQSLGSVLIGLNIWSAVSEFEVLGEFGWFYGDFFIEEVPSTLYYTGIYRFLNNPEYTTGCAGLYGLALISGSWTLFSLAVFSQGCNYLFHVFVEEPHMKKLYGDNIRKKAGIEEAISTIVNEAKKTPTGAKVAKKINDLRSQSEIATDKLLGKAERLVSIIKEAIEENEKKKKKE